MKVFILECTEDELKANRGFMDAIVDACQGFVNAFYGTTTPCSTEQEFEPQESEKINCKTTKCENCKNHDYCDHCKNHNYCDYEPQESEG